MYHDSRIVNETVREIVKMSPQYIVLPSEAELLFQQSKFMNYRVSTNPWSDWSKNPGGENGELFRNPKGFFSKRPND